MAIETAPLTPLSERDTEDTLSEYRDDVAIAGSVVWELLVHDPVYGPDLARLAMIPTPKRLDLDADDVYAAMWDLITEAAELGYTMAKLDLTPFDGAKVTSADVSRALAALLHRPTVEDGQPFDLEYRTKRDAAA